LNKHKYEGFKGIKVNGLLKPIEIKSDCEYIYKNCPLFKKQSILYIHLKVY